MVKMKFVMLVVAANLCFQACRKQETQEDPFQAKIPEQAETLQKIPELVKLSDAVKKELDEWEEYMGFENSLRAILEADDPNEVSVVIPELLEKEKNLTEGPFPEKFDDPRIKSRILVLKTRLYELKAQVDEKILSDSLLHKNQYVLTEVFNALRNQFLEISQGGVDERILSPD